MESNKNIGNLWGHKFVSWKMEAGSSDSGDDDIMEEAKL